MTWGRRGRCRGRRQGIHRTGIGPRGGGRPSDVAEEDREARSAGLVVRSPDQCRPPAAYLHARHEPDVAVAPVLARRVPARVHPPHHGREVPVGAAGHKKGPGEIGALFSEHVRQHDGWTCIRPEPHAGVDRTGKADSAVPVEAEDPRIRAVGSRKQELVGAIVIDVADVPGAPEVTRKLGTVLDEWRGEAVLPEQFLSRPEHAERIARGDDGYRLNEARRRLWNGLPGERPPGESQTCDGQRGREPEPPAPGRPSARWHAGPHRLTGNRWRDGGARGGVRSRADGIGDIRREIQTRLPANPQVDFAAIREHDIRRAGVQPVNRHAKFAFPSLRGADAAPNGTRRFLSSRRGGRSVVTRSLAEAVHPCRGARTERRDYTAPLALLDDSGTPGLAPSPPTSRTWGCAVHRPQPHFPVHDVPPEEVRLRVAVEVSRRGDWSPVSDTVPTHVSDSRVGPFIVQIHVAPGRVPPHQVRHPFASPERASADDLVLHLRHGRHVVLRQFHRAIHQPHPHLAARGVVPQDVGPTVEVVVAGIPDAVVGFGDRSHVRLRQLHCAIH